MLFISSLQEWRDPSILSVGLLSALLVFVLWLVLPASKYTPALFIAFAGICMSLAFILQRRRPPHTFPYEQIIDVAAYGSIILLHVRDVTGNRPILFHLAKPEESDAFPAELRGKMLARIS